MAELPRLLRTSLPDATGSPWVARLVALLCVSAAFELLFVGHSINRMDEAWPLYAAMRLHAGGVLYDDVFWVFPPGHVWTAWLAWWLDPPGLLLTRCVYAAFCVALSGGIYLLARRLMPEPFALLAGALVALAAPRSHLGQMLFGYRYLILALLPLLAYDRRLRGGSARWMWGAGALMGLALVFRVTPAFSASCGIAVALVAASPSWRRCLEDGLRFGGGLGIVVAPVLAWFAISVGLGRLWQEVIAHPALLALLQSQPLPELAWPGSLRRAAVWDAFVSLQFRLVWGLYLGYAVALLVSWVRARRAGRPFEHGLLTAVTVLGAVFFLRSLTRSDEPHLDSVIPPACLLFAHLSAWLFAAVLPGGAEGERGWRPRAAWACAAGLLAAWVYLLGTDVMVRPEVRGHNALRSAPETRLRRAHKAENIDRTVELLARVTPPGGVVLNLSPSPLFHVLTRRPGPGHRDLLMPGTFLDEGEEGAFVERLEAAPPDAVIWPVRAFDRMPSRSVEVTAPKLTAWVKERYEFVPGQTWPRPIQPGEHRWLVMLPRAGPGRVR